MLRHRRGLDRVQLLPRNLVEHALNGWLRLGLSEMNHSRLGRVLLGAHNCILSVGNGHMPARFGLHVRRQRRRILAVSCDGQQSEDGEDGFHGGAQFTLVAKIFPYASIDPALNAARPTR